MTLFLTLCLGSEPDWTLSPIIVGGSPADALNLDPVRPSHGGRSDKNSGTGSIERSISRELALPMTDYGRAGAASSLRGFGRSSEDVGTETLGVPLNYAQGGGFDLSVFPQFLWSDYRFQSGPSLGAFDPRAVSGGLTLVPWSELALRDSSIPNRVEQNYSGLGQSQTSLALHSENQVAAVAGFSAGQVQGPSGIFSARWSAGSLGRLEGRVHLIGTDLNASTPGPESSPSPLAKQQTSRAIPVLQADYKGQEYLVKSSVFQDWTYIRYEDPSSPGSRGRNHLIQTGTENVLFAGDWRLGVSARHVDFRQLAGPLPTEDIFSTSVARSWSLGDFLLEPMLQGTGVTQFGFRLGGGLGVRMELGEAMGTHALFTRVMTSNRFPSLLDRYYIDSTFVGNSGVTPERDTTLTGGYEWKAPTLKMTLEYYYQHRDNVLLTSFNNSTLRTVVNSGTAHVSALMHSVQWSVLPILDLGQRLSWSRSLVDSTGLEFPYIPEWLERMSVEFHAADRDPAWRLGADLRASSSASVTATTEVAGYAVIDLRTQYRLLRWGEVGQLTLLGQVENATGETYRVIRDYPIRGQIYSAALSAEF